MRAADKVEPRRPRMLPGRRRSAGVSSDVEQRGRRVVEVELLALAARLEPVPEDGAPGGAEAAGHVEARAGPFYHL